MCHLKALNCEGKYPGGAGIIKQKGSFGLFCLPAPGMPAMTPDLDRARIKLKRTRPKKWAEFSLDVVSAHGFC
jgi:hypothetical protein